MNTVGDVLEFLETLAPRYMKMDWDHVGLLCGRSGREVRRILVALDPFQDVCQEAADWGAELLVTHHPLYLPASSVHYGRHLRGPVHPLPGGPGHGRHQRPHQSGLCSRRVND